MRGGTGARSLSATCSDVTDAPSGDEAGVLFDAPNSSTWENRYIWIAPEEEEAARLRVASPAGTPSGTTTTTPPGKVDKGISGKACEEVPVAVATTVRRTMADAAESPLPKTVMLGAAFAPGEGTGTRAGRIKWSMCGVAIRNRRHEGVALSPTLDPELKPENSKLI
jgi:hypothetical protein